MADVPFDPGFAVDRRVAPPNVLLVDDHRLLAQMMVEDLQSRGYRAASIDVEETDIAERILRLEPDLVLLDAVFNDDEDGGMGVLRSLRDRSPAPIVILTGVSDELRHAEFLAEGARAVISKADSFDGVIEQVEAVLDGLDPMGVNRRQDLARRLQAHQDDEAERGSALQQLTDRELATLQALVDGVTVEEIAARRTVAVSTVRSQVRSVLSKLDAHSQIEVVAIAARLGMRPSEESA